MASLQDSSHASEGCRELGRVRTLLPELSQRWCRLLSQAGLVEVTFLADYMKVHLPDATKLGSALCRHDIRCADCQDAQQRCAICKVMLCVNLLPQKALL